LNEQLISKALPAQANKGRPSSLPLLLKQKRKEKRKRGRAPPCINMLLLRHRRKIFIAKEGRGKEKDSLSFSL